MYFDVTTGHVKRRRATFLEGHDEKERTCMCSMSKKHSGAGIYTMSINEYHTILCNSTNLLAVLAALRKPLLLLLLLVLLCDIHGSTMHG